MNLIEDPRAAGQIRRYHTWAIHQEQSVAEHTWQVLRILLTIWPTCPRNLIVYGLMHDAGEMSGDIQYPFKIMFAELRAGADKAEAHVLNEQRKALGVPDFKMHFTPFEKLMFKVADNLEMWEFGIREVNMGNRYAEIIVSRMKSAVANILSSMTDLKESSTTHVDVMMNVTKYMQRRLEMEDF